MDTLSTYPSIPASQPPGQSPLGGAPPPTPFHFHTLPVLIYTIIIVLTTSLAFFLGKNYVAKQQPVRQPVVSIPTAIPTALPTTDPTAGWKTYINTKYKFSFLYPSDIALQEPTNNLGPNLVLNYDHKFKNSFSINLYINNLENNNFSQWEKQKIRTINNNTWNIFSHQSCGPEECEIRDYVSIASKNNNEFIFMYKETGRIYFDQILSTVKFLD